MAAKSLAIAASPMLGVTFWPLSMSTVFLGQTGWNAALKVSWHLGQRRAVGVNPYFAVPDSLL